MYEDGREWENGESVGEEDEMGEEGREYELLLLLWMLSSVLLYSRLRLLSLRK